jgi:hypothetical protein
MSDHRPASPGGPNRRRNPFVAVLMVLAGLIMLLPGLCSLVFGSWILSSIGVDAGGVGMLSLWLAGLVIAAMGIDLIVRALRR